MALPADRFGDNVTLLREFLLDEAPGGLMASLRQRRLAGDVALNWLYQDRHLGWLALVFASDRPEEVDRQITHWLQALQQTTPEQQQHYYPAIPPPLSGAVASRSAAPAGIRLCPRRAARRVRRFCAALQAAPSVSLACQTVSPGQPVATQGFSLPLSRWSPRPVSDLALAFAFIRRPLASSWPKARRKPRRCVTSRHRESRRGSCCDRPSDCLAHAGRRAGARGTAASISCRPAPCWGHGEWHLFDGSWQLILQLPASGRRPEAILQAILRQLALPVASLTPPPESIAIRYLMAQLPERLGTSGHQKGWLAALAGGSAEDAQWVALQLSLITAPVNPPMPAPAPCRRGVERLVYPGGDTALLVFIPLPDGASLAAPAAAGAAL